MSNGMRSQFGLELSHQQPPILASASGWWSAHPPVFSVPTAQPPLRAKLTQALQKHEYHYFDPNRLLELGKTQSVVAYAEDPNKFYVQICEATINRRFREMSAQLNAEMGGLPSERGSMMPMAFFVRSPVAAFFAGSWYRGKILSILQSTQQFSIQFVDFGNTETLPQHQVKPLDVKFLQLPPVAVYCTLRNARPLEANWPFHARVFMESLIDKTPGPLCIFCQFDQVRMAFEVDLVMHQSPPFGSILDHLIKSGWATPVSNLLGLESAPTAITPPMPAARAESVFPQQKPFISGHREALVQVAYAISPVDFFLHVVSIRENLEQVVLACATQYTGSAATCPGPLPAPVTRGQSCVASFAEDGGWYRAKTLQDLGTDGISVFYVDFGNMSVCARDGVRYVADDPVLLKTPPLAVHCCINGLSDSNVTVTNFDENGRNEFENLVDSSECVFLGQAEDGRYDVVLEKSDVDFVGAYLKDTPQAAAPEEVSSAVEEQAPKQAVNSRGGVEVPGLPALDLDVDGDSFLDCRVVHVDEDGSLTVNLRNAPPLLEDMQKTMKSHYEKAGEKAVVVNPTRQQLCVLRPEGQEEWRRVLVLERTNPKELVVYCVDGGQTLQVQKDRMLQLCPELAFTPPQAICCHLEGVENPHSKLDEIRRLVLNKDVVVHTKGSHKNGFLVTMQLDSASGDASINDLLKDSTGSPPSRHRGDHQSAARGQSTAQSRQAKRNSGERGAQPAHQHPRQETQNSEERGAPASRQERGAKSTRQQRGAKSTHQERGAKSTHQERGAKSTRQHPQQGTQSSEERGAPSARQERGAKSTRQERGAKSTRQERGAKSTHQERGAPAAHQELGATAARQHSHQGTQSSEESGAPAARQERGATAARQHSQQGTQSSEESGAPPTRQNPRPDRFFHRGGKGGRSRGRNFN